MTTAPYELLPEPGGVLARINVRGSAVLASPSINRARRSPSVSGRPPLVWTVYRDAEVVGGDDERVSFQGNETDFGVVDDLVTPVVLARL